MDSLEVAAKALVKLRDYVEEWKSKGEGKIDEKYKKEFEESMANDLGTAEALAVVWKMVKADIPSGDKLATLLKFDEILGLKLEREEIKEEIPDEIVLLAEEREIVRGEKDWSESDRLRDLIKEKGYLVEDGEGGYKIKKI